MIADPVEFKIAMLNQKEKLEQPRPGAAALPARGPDAPAMQRAEPMPPRAGSDRVAVMPMRRRAPAAAGTRAAPPPAARRATRRPRTSAPRSSASPRCATRGLITPEEYEAKKRDLLERM